MPRHALHQIHLLGPRQIHDPGLIVRVEEEPRGGAAPRWDEGREGCRRIRIRSGAFPFFFFVCGLWVLIEVWEARSHSVVLDRDCERKLGVQSVPTSPW